MGTAERRRAMRRALVAAVLLANVAVVGVATSYATGGPDSPAGSPGGAGPVPSPLPALPVLGSPSPAPSPKPSPKPAGPRVAGPQDRWALLVGITDYRAPVHDTAAGAQDAAVVRDLLLKSGWRSDHIRLLRDGAATGQALADGLSWLGSHSGSGTFSLFHYSGHVKQRDGHEYLWPVDNAFFSDASLATAMKRVRGVSWTSVAGCEAAGFDEGLSSKTRLVTGSSAVDEKSYEYPDWGMSVWAGLLFDQALRKKGADLDGDGHVTVQEAYRWAAPRAAEITKNQQPYGPQHPYLRGGSGSLRLDAPVVG